jgi:RNA polymerase sigma-70 factor (ECF subfamily)
MEAIQALSPAYKTVFNLYVIEGFQHKEIAKQLGISEGTSKSNLAKAKMRLRTLIIEKNRRV